MRAHTEKCFKHIQSDVIQLACNLNPGLAKRV